MRKILLGLILIVLLSFSLEAKQYSFQGLTGAGTYPGTANLALDGWPVAGDAGPPVVSALADKALAHGHDNAGNYYTYVYNSSSSATESVPDVITPNDSAGPGRWLKLGLGIAEFLQYQPISAPSYSEGLTYYDTNKHAFVIYNDESEVSQEIGQEGYIRVYNDTGVDIADGKVCYLSGHNGTNFTVALANANSAITSQGTIGFSTHLIENGTYGYITRWGTINDQVTTGLTSGKILYLDVTDGDVAETPPGSPNYLVSVGKVGFVSATVGTIDVNISAGSNTGDVISIFNGAVLEHSKVSASSDGVTVTLSYEKDGGGDLSLFFNGTFSVFDTTPAATISLIPGSDASPTENYIFIPESTRLLTVSTSGWPTEQHVPIATAKVPSASSAQTDGLRKLHAWTDHLFGDNDQGHISHVDYWIRQQFATYQEPGIDPTVTITVNGALKDNVDYAVTSGTVLQLHPHAWPAIDTVTTGHMYAINDPDTTERRITDLGVLEKDSLGVTLLSNNTYYSLVIWGIISEDAVDCQLYINLPSGSYISSTGAINDNSKYSNYTLPTPDKGAAFLISRLTLRYQTASSGTITQIDLEDLRGKIPSTAAGGGGSIQGSEFVDSSFRVYNVSDITKQLQFDTSGITTGNTRTVLWPDRNVDVGNLTDKTADEIITGNWQFSQGINAGASSDPRMTSLDSDAPGTDKDMGYFTIPYVDGADGSENADILLYAKQAGTDVIWLQMDESDDRIETTKEIITTAAISGGAKFYTYAANHVLTAEEVRGGTIYCTANLTLTIPARTGDENFSVIPVGAVTVSVDPNASDLINLNGSALDDGDKITSSGSAGTGVVITDLDSTGFYAQSNGFTDGGP